MGMDAFMPFRHELSASGKNGHVSIIGLSVEVLSRTPTTTALCDILSPILFRELIIPCVPPFEAVQYLPPKEVIVPLVLTIPYLASGFFPSRLRILRLATFLPTGQISPSVGALGVPALLSALDAPAP